jgi:hypothetical protein
MGRDCRVAGDFVSISSFAHRRIILFALTPTVDVRSYPV